MLRNGMALTNYLDVPLYTATYETGNTADVVGVEYPVSLPDQPPIEEMHNYGLPVEDQKWYRFDIPVDFKSRSAARRVPWQRVKRFVDAMWHKRRNGEWWLIKGEPVYITGTAWVYFNFWMWATNSICDFYMHSVWWFQVMRDVEMDKTCFGLVEIKPRRAFSTEMSLCWGWDVCTRYFDSNFGIMSKGDDDAQKAFDRLTFSNENMIWFFRPTNNGKSRPAASLDFRYSIDKESDFSKSTASLNSRIWFEPTVEGKFDGTKLRAALLDEKGKILVSKMNIFKQWNIMRECLSLLAGTKIVGKAILPSTIEELDNGRSITIVKKLWDQSNPARRDRAGRTVSGCKRMFRPFWISGECDEYGYPKSDEARAARAARIEAMESEGLHDDISDYKRKYPETVEEALAMPASETILPIPLIDRALDRCRDIAEKDMTNPLRAIPGTLAWVDRFGGDVRWMPNPNGRWHISRHPDVPNAFRPIPGGKIAPGNIGLFAMGVDPIDMTKPIGEGSDGACTVGAMHDYIRDSHCVFDEYDILKQGEMWSDSCVCDYHYRPELPEEFYQDMLMTAIYYGTQMLVETQKPGLINWGYTAGFGAYFAQKPQVSDTKWIAGKQGHRARDVGVYANTETIGNWYTFMRSHVIRRYRNYTHPRLLTDMRQLTDKNRTQRDLTVSWGWCLSMMMQKAAKTKRERYSRSTEASAGANKRVLALFPVGTR